MVGCMETITDSRGVRHDFPAPPERVVSLVPSLTETVADLGCGAALAGITKFCRFPEEIAARVPKVGGTKNPDIAAIIRMKPGLVLLNEEENRIEDYEALRAAGLRVFATSPRTFTDGVTLLRQMGRMFGRIVEADRMATEIEERAELYRQAKPGRGIRLFYPVWNRPLMTVNGDTYINDVLEMLGFVNPFASRRDRYPEITEAELEQELPQVILLPDEPFEFNHQHRAEWLMKSQYPASRHFQVHLVDGSYFCWYGSRQLKALGYFEHLVGPPSVRPAE